MELFTLKRNPSVYNESLGMEVIRFEKQDVIQGFESLIWTDRYYGDGDIEFVMPFNQKWIDLIPEETFVGIEESNELRIIQNIVVENKKLKFTGISLLSWLNNRFVRNSKSHKVQSLDFSGLKPGETLWTILTRVTGAGSIWLDSDSTNIHPSYLEKLVIPDIGLHSYTDFGSPITTSVSFGPLYNELRKIAEAYGVGMQLLLETNLNPDAEKPLGFRAYRGLNKSFTQDPDSPQNPIVRFSTDLDSFSGASELRSTATYKTLAFAFASSNEADLGKVGGNCAGVAFAVGMGTEDDDTSAGFNAKAILVYDDELSGFQEPLSHVEILAMMERLNFVARKALSENALIRVVDGQIVSTRMFQYGRDFNLGDIVEIQGDTGLTSIARVTEYIRAQDAQGERGYPGISVIAPQNDFESPDPDTLAPPAVTDNDLVGDALELEGNQGKLTTTNVDCTTDGIGLDEDVGNFDWLVRELSNNADPADDSRNWRTMWFKWAVPTDDWVDDSSVFSVFITDYNKHMILFVMTPNTGALPDAGSPPDPDKMNSYLSFGSDTTGLSKEPPYRMLARTIFANFWTDTDDNEPWIYIGVATPPEGMFGNSEGDKGSKFTLQWYFTP